MAHILANDLRAAVLKAAIQGRLTKHNDSDTNVIKTIKQIKDEKTYLFKSKKINKEKPFSKSDKYVETPFDIPDTWEWIRFGDLMINKDSYRVPVSKAERAKKEKVYDYYGASGVIDKIDSYIFDEPNLLIGEDGANLLSRSTPIAFVAHGKYWVNNHAHVLNTCAGVSLKFVTLYINAIDLSPYVSGTAQPKMNQENMNAIWVALPPIEEQARIVAKVDEIMAKIDEYEKLENQLVKLKEQFPQDMKDSLLRSAFEGSFTNNSYIDNENSDWAFDKIVDGWNYQSYEDVCTITTGLSFPKTEQCLKSDSDLRILRGGNIYDDYRYRLKDDDIYVKYREKYTKLLSGDVITPSVTSLEKHCKVGFIENDLKNITAGGFVYIFRTKDMNMLLPRYLMYYITSPQNKAMCMPNIHKSGQAFYNLKKNGLIKQIIPIPPIEEQQRIVDKLDELLPLVDKLAELN